jgi:homoserine O-acetyltransferase
LNALRTAAGCCLIAGSAPIQMQLALPTRDAADEFLQKYMPRRDGGFGRQRHSVRGRRLARLRPVGDLEKIKAPLLQINSGDDFINPPELGIAEREIKRVKNGRFMLLPASDQTHGHGTHTWAAVWQQYLAQLLEASKSPPQTRQLRLALVAVRQR